MALAHNPRIVTDGLVLCLDAGNPKSYPGTGTTWYDLTGNGYNGTLINGPTFNSSSRTFTLDGVNDYIQITIDLRGVDYTVLGAARYVSVGGRTFSALSNNWLMGHWSSSTVKHYAVGWVTDSGTAEQRDTNWRIYAASADFSADSWKFYVNGSLDVSNTGGSNGPQNFSIGGYAGVSEFSNSEISFISVYNRELTADEVAQNFNALRGRFGI